MCPEEAKGTHNRLCLNLERPHVATIRDVKLKSSRRGILLRKFHTDRVTADYKLSEQIDDADAAQAVEDARVILSIT
jgi:hypothetical protein